MSIHILGSATHKLFCIRRALKANTSSLGQLKLTNSIDFKNTNVLEVMIVQ